MLVKFGQRVRTNTKCFGYLRTDNSPGSLVVRAPVLQAEVPSGVNDFSEICDIGVPKWLLARD